MRVIANMCVYNEAGRYLQSCIQWLKARDEVDKIFVWDDRSTDDSARVAYSAGADVMVRDKQDVSFLEHEAAFRELGWNHMVAHYDLQPGDWVVGIDADEFAIGSIKEACRTDASSVAIRIPEIFSLNPVARRIDGYWDDQVGVRFCAYQEGEQYFVDKPMACGVLPKYANTNPVTDAQCQIMHFGYADIDDRQAKYARYRHRTGHSRRHIESIMSPPKLVGWDQEMPRFWRGVK